MRVEFGKFGFCKYPEYLLHHYDIIMVLCFHTRVLPGGRVGKQNLKIKYLQGSVRVYKKYLL